MVEHMTMSREREARHTMNANRRSVIVGAGVALLLASLWIALSVIPATATEHVYYFHNDHLGTPQAMSDASGRKVWEAEYEPFGKATVNQDPDGDGQIVVNNLRFPGQYYDAETGLHYNYHRDYDPATGRYLQPDPIGLRGGSNLYSYVDNNPIVEIDPSGLIKWRGTQTGGTYFFFGHFLFLLKSDCVNKKCASVEVSAKGVGVSANLKYLKFSLSESDVEFEDKTDRPYPEVFNGEFIYAGWGAAAGKHGKGASFIQLGGARSVGPSRPNGIDFSAGVLFGDSEVTSSSLEDCCSE